MTVQPPQSEETLRVCRYCEVAGAKKMGHDYRGQQRFICRNCRRTWIDRRERDKTPFGDFRVSLSRCYSVLKALEQGSTIREAARVVGIDNKTAGRIVAVSGYCRRCITCNNPLPKGNRFYYCSDSCQAWRQKTPRVARVAKPKADPLFTATANLLRYATLNDTTGIAGAAIELARQFSETNAAEYLGPCYEAIVWCDANGVQDDAEIWRKAQECVSQMRTETRTYGPSVDSMKADWDFDASFAVPPSEGEGEDGVATVEQATQPATNVDWADLNENLAKEIGLHRGLTEFLRRRGVDIIATTMDWPANRRAIWLERQMKIYRKALSRGEQPCSLSYPIDSEPGELAARPERYEAVRNSGRRPFRRRKHKPARSS